MPGVSGEIFVITASNFPFHDSGRDNVIQCSSPCPRLRFQGSASELQVRIQWPPPCALPLSGSLPGWECTVECQVVAVAVVQQKKSRSGELTKRRGKI